MTKRKPLTKREYGLPEPKPKRKNYTPAMKRKIRERSGGRCEVHLIPRLLAYAALPHTCKRKGEEIDHINPATFGGPATMENAADLCGVCHGIKTAANKKMSAKSNRLRGEAGQSKRRDKRGGSSIKGRSSWPPKGSQKLPTKADRERIRR